LAPDGRDDRRLLADFLGGDKRAFTELVTRHEDRLFALALRMTGNRSDALDATQEAFVAAFRRAGSYRGDAAVGTWLYRIAVNATQDLLRSRGRHLAQDIDAPESGLPASGERVDDAVAARVDVARALAALPEEYREAVVLHDLGGVPYDEIGYLTGAPMGTVKSRISRGRRRLAELLEHRNPAVTSKLHDPEATPGGALP
jgi:RNA polymerase sigma-70 factor, ECF subfamily